MSNLATTVNFLLMVGWNGKCNTFLLELYFQKGERTDVFLVVGKKDDSSVNSSKDNKDKSDEICLFNVWKYCKHNGKPYMKYLWSALPAEVLPAQSSGGMWSVSISGLAVVIVSSHLFAL